MTFILTLFIPVILVWYPISSSFDSKLNLSQKIACFLILPIVEVLISVPAILQARSMEINLLANWQLYLIYFISSLGLSSTLMVTLLEELQPTVKRVLRISTLVVFSFIFTWGFVVLN
ncbi:MAG: hypothetical protein AAGE84_24805 [Cyanobacteria bacterium P01_G01_bin.39]